MPFGRKSPLEVITLPGAILAYKYSQFRQRRREAASRKVTERELTALHHKIEKLLSKLDESELEPPSSQEDECVICINAKATMQTSPCGHRVVCRRCFVKTIQSAVAQRLLPLRCVICRARINRLTSTSGSWRLQNSASSYSMGTRSWGVPGSASSYSVDARVTQSASLFSMSSGSSCTSGMSGISSCSSGSALSGTSGMSSTSSASNASSVSGDNHKHSGSCSTGCLGAIPRNPSYHQYQNNFSNKRHGQYSFRHRTLEMPNKLSPIKEFPLRSNNNNNSSSSGSSSNMSHSSRRRTPSPVNNPGARFRSYTDPPAGGQPKPATTTAVVPQTTSATTSTNTPTPTSSATNKKPNSNNRAVVMNPAQLMQQQVNNGSKSTVTGPTKIGLNSKIAPVASKSPINNTNMATGKPITTAAAPVKAVSSTRVVKSVGGGSNNNNNNNNNCNNSVNNNHQSNNSAKNGGGNVSHEKNDNKRNESIESKKKREDKLRLKLEKEAKKEEKRLAKEEAKEAKERTNRKKTTSFFSRYKEPKEVTEALLSAEVT